MRAAQRGHAARRPRAPRGPPAHARPLRPAADDGRDRRARRDAARGCSRRCRHGVSQAPQRELLAEHRSPASSSRSTRRAAFLRTPLQLGARRGRAARRRARVPARAQGVYRARKGRGGDARSADNARRSGMKRRLPLPRLPLPRALRYDGRATPCCAGWGSLPRADDGQAPPRGPRAYGRRPRPRPSVEGDGDSRRTPSRARAPQPLLGRAAAASADGLEPQNPNGAKPTLEFVARVQLASSSAKARRSRILRSARRQAMYSCTAEVEGRIVNLLLLLRNAARRYAAFRNPPPASAPASPRWRSKSCAAAAP